MVSTQYKVFNIHTPIIVLYKSHIIDLISCIIHNGWFSLPFDVRHFASTR